MDAKFRLGNFYQTLEKPEAEACYRECAALDSKHVDAMNNLALLLQDAGEIDEAEAYYLRCVECDDRCVDAMFNWATLKLEHRQDLDGCRVLINQIVQINPELKEHKLVKALRGDDEESSRFDGRESNDKDKTSRSVLSTVRRPLVALEALDPLEAASFVLRGPVIVSFSRRVARACAPFSRLSPFPRLRRFPPPPGPRLASFRRRSPRAAPPPTGAAPSPSF